MGKIILPICYLPPVSYVKTLIDHASGDILMEQHEHYPKQTYRSRASILGANGKLNLYVPVQKGRGVHTRMKDVRISYDAPWQRLHWLSLQTAYRSSPYFEYYEDDFAPFYSSKHEFLMDFNMELTQLIIHLLKAEVSWMLTDTYQDPHPDGEDYRQRIHPKREPVTNIDPYRQVFSDRFGFTSDLSVVDLLFNEGPQSLSKLRA